MLSFSGIKQEFPFIAICNAFFQAASKKREWDSLKSRY